MSAGATAEIAQLQQQVRELRDQRDEAVQALRLTHEYVGTDMLPAVEGWSWYDALRHLCPSYVATLHRRD